ncbi:MAG TPA: hypothetical protein VGG72_14035 [Bryobacteraceae bacterium]|jgi:uncharacterized protein (TIGR03437 family)
MLACKHFPRTLGLAAMLMLMAVAVHAQTCTVATPCVAPPGVVGQPYSVSFYAVSPVGGPYSNFAIASGSLPPGITMIVSSSGIVTLSGIPTSAVGSPFVFVITFTDGLGNSSTPGEISIAITGAPGPPGVSAEPGFLSFAIEAGSSATQQQSLLVFDTGGGSVTFNASVQSGSSWVSVSPTTGTATAAAPVTLTITANAANLGISSNHDMIQITSSAGSVSVPVTLFASGHGQILGVGASGVYFGIVQGLGSSLTQTVPVLDTGDANSAVNWTAVAAPASTGANFISLASVNGQATPTAPGALIVSLNNNASTLAPGTYYQLIDLADNNALNSPQYVTAVLNVVSATGDPAPPPPPPPILSPGGLVFIGPAGQNISSQQFTVNVSTTAFQSYSTSTALPAGQSWLRLSPLTGAASLGTPATITVFVKTTGLPKGVYQGSAQVTFADGTTLSENITMILTGTGSTSAASSGEPAAHTAATTNANGCTPSNLVLTETGLANSFSIPAGWPSNLVVSLNDDCGDDIANGAVTASFSNGDPPLSLVTQGSTGQYSATWQPQHSVANTIVTLLGTVGGLNPAKAQIAGTVAANQAPVLTPHGILHNLDPVIGGALAPGTWAQVYGANLSGYTGTTSGSPIPTAFQNTQLVVGGRLAPLYYLSSGQLVAEIPEELTPGQQFSAVEVTNGALTLPISIDVVPQVPGVATYADGVTLNAQHLDFTSVTAASPAHPGETVIAYLEGMGVTNPPVLSGVAAPANPLAYTAIQPTVTVNHENAAIVFAGLSPGIVGVYQIDFTVPATAATGNLPVAITQGTATAQPTMMPVAPAP